jgi:DNA polymerase-3 subunit delta'
MNWDILGHDWAVDLLKEHVQRGSVRHAYLITGPQGVGRRTLALRLAQALNCLQPSGTDKPCRKCRACVQIEKMIYPDLSMTQAERVGGILKVDQIRELQHNLALAPYEGRYRVALILRFEEANINAMNALLKTLEEPAPQVVILLTAENAERLLPTIVSRCEILRLRPLPVDQVYQGLKDRWELPEDQARLLAHVSGGRPGYALGLYQEPDHLKKRQTWLDDHYQLITENRIERFAYAEAIAKNKDDLRLNMLVWLSFWRDVLLKAAGSSAAIVNIDRQNEIDTLAEQLGLQTAYQTVAALERTLGLFDININVRLAVEVLMLDLPYC